MNIITNTNALKGMLKRAQHDKKKYVIPNLFRDLELGNDNKLIPFVLVTITITTGEKMIRKAKLDDIKEIQRLIKLYSPRGGILPRSLSELYDHLRDFFVFVRNRKIIGICALHICWDDLAEIRSLVVEEDYRNKGIGAQLTKASLKESKLLGVKRVFALTYEPEFFERLGFERVDKAVLPHKIWADCLKCVKFPDCDEVAVAKELN